MTIVKDTYNTVSQISVTLYANIFTLIQFSAFAIRRQITSKHKQHDNVNYHVHNEAIHQ